MHAGFGLLQLINTVSLTMYAALQLSSGSTLLGACVGVSAACCALASFLAYRRADREQKSGSGKDSAHSAETRV